MKQWHWSTCIMDIALNEKLTTTAPMKDQRGAFKTEREKSGAHKENAEWENLHFKQHTLVFRRKLRVAREIILFKTKPTVFIANTTSKEFKTWLHPQVSCLFIVNSYYSHYPKDSNITHTWGFETWTATKKFGANLLVFLSLPSSPAPAVVDSSTFSDPFLFRFLVLAPLRAPLDASCAGWNKVNCCYFNTTDLTSI